MLDDFGFEEAIRGYCNESTVNTDPAKRIEVICENGFEKAMRIASVCSKCKEAAINELDNQLVSARALLEEVDEGQKEKYEDMILENYQKFLGNIVNMKYRERNYVPQQPEPRDRIEHIISYGFPRAARIAGVSKERGIRIFNDYAEEAYTMIRKLNSEEREKYKTLLDEKYDASFTVVMSGVRFTE